MHLALITSLLKSREYWPKFQKKNKNFILFVSSYPGYDITRNAYSGYLILFSGQSNLGYDITCNAYSEQLQTTTRL